MSKISVSKFLENEIGGNLDHCARIELSCLDKFLRVDRLGHWGRADCPVLFEGPRVIERLCEEVLDLAGSYTTRQLLDLVKMSQSARWSRSRIRSPRAGASGEEREIFYDTSVRFVLTAIDEDRDCLQHVFSCYHGEMFEDKPPAEAADLWAVDPVKVIRSSREDVIGVTWRVAEIAQPKCDADIVVCPDDLGAMIRVARSPRWSLHDSRAWKKDVLGRRSSIILRMRDGWSAIVESGVIACGLEYVLPLGANRMSAARGSWADEIVGTALDGERLRLSPAFVARMQSCWGRWRLCAQAVDRGQPAPRRLTAAEIAAARAWDRTFVAVDRSRRLRARVLASEAARAARQVSISSADADLDLALANCRDVD